MTKRSVALVGVLIVMVMVGSAVIGAVSAWATSDAANGAYYTFLPLVMKAFPYSGYLLSGSFEMKYGPSSVEWAAPFGWSTTNIDTSWAREFIFPEECVAQNLTAMLIPEFTPWDPGYKLYMRIRYQPPTGSSGIGVVCQIDDPAITCSSSDQLTIPAGSRVAINIYQFQGRSDGKTWVPFSWECN